MNILFNNKIPAELHPEFHIIKLLIEKGMLKNLNSQLCSTSLVLSSSLKQLVYMYLSQLMSTFTNYLKVHRSLDGYFIL